MTNSDLIHPNVISRCQTKKITELDTEVNSSFCWLPRIHSLFSFSLFSISLLFKDGTRLPYFSFILTLIYQHPKFLLYTMFSQHPFTPWALPSKVTIGESEFSNMRTQECNHDKLLCKNKNLQDQPLFFKM